MTVFAGCRNITDDRAVSLKECTSSRLHLVKVDVTDDQSVETAVEYVSQNLHGKGKNNQHLHFYITFICF